MQSHFKYCTSIKVPSLFLQVIIMYLASCLNARYFGRVKNLIFVDLGDKFLSEVCRYTLYRICLLILNIIPFMAVVVVLLKPFFFFRLFFILSMQYNHLVFNGLHIVFATVVWSLH